MMKYLYWQKKKKTEHDPREYLELNFETGEQEKREIDDEEEHLRKRV